jgi:mono/diheme cytochrome c family protein
VRIPSQAVSRLTRLLPLLVVVVIAAGCAASDQPDALRQGRSTYGDVCSVCHGARGQGGAGPALDKVTETWPLCTDQVEWIGLGSEGWRTQHGDTYGAPNKPVAGGMPAHADQLTVEEMRLVAAFERSAYGGVDPDTALEQCGVG